MRNTSENPSTRRATLGALLALPLTAAAAQHVPVPRSRARAVDHSELLKVREGVWRSWFAGDRKALLAILPEDFAGISLGEGAARDRDTVVKDAEGFVGGGNRLIELQFPENHVQVLGAVHVIYCRFSFTTVDKEGKPTTTAGRATEVFVKQGPRWSHPGWHLDSGR